MCILCIPCHGIHISKGQWNERLKPKTDGSKCLTDTGFRGGAGTPNDRDEVVYYEKLKRDLKTKTINGYRCDERL